MLNTIYHHVWRPTVDANDSYCTSPNFAKGFFQLCDGYAACENQLRKHLHAHESQAFDQINKKLFFSMKQVMFEFQEHYRLILSSNKKIIPSSRQDFSILEAPMHLSEYQCTILIHGSEIHLKPFDWQEASLPWYLDDISVFSFSNKYKEQLTLRHMILATAALRCLLYAQFGTASDAAIMPLSKEKETQNYYPAKSLFHVTPPVFSEDDWYHFNNSTTPTTFTPYPFFSVTHHKSP